jgi:hypothetical protein
MSRGSGGDRANPGLSQPGQIAFHGPQADPGLTGQLRPGNRLPGDAEEFHQPLLPLHPPKREVAVS